MNVSINWVAALLGREIDPEEAARLITLRAVPVEAVTPLFHDLAEIVVGLVEAAEPHPDADRLTLCRVNVGSETFEVVCGAPNVRPGVKYAYAAVGTTLPGGLTLTKRKIRGVLSHGMLCSARELGLGTDHEGIMALATDAAPGTPLLEAMPLADTRLELDVTANRPDLLCQRGVARELGAALGATVKLPAIPGSPGPGPAARRVSTRGTVGGVEVVLEDTQGCPRYMASVIRGLSVAASPAWLEARLRALGARPINNVVDATNYVLHELNQPLHAFDLAKLRGGRIVVRRPRSRETITTLDGVERRPTADMTMICDGEGPVAVGGVMGGETSEVGGGTTDVVLECAYFDPRRIRSTRMALRMSTDASYRFERGIDLHGMPGALQRAVDLIRAVAGGDEAEPALDLCPQPPQTVTVFLRPERVEHLLGVAVPRSEIERLLLSVGFAVAPKDGRLAVQVPGWRPDVTREVDLIEEVARLRGYDTFPVELRPQRPTTVPTDPIEPLKARLVRVLTALGLHEAVSVPFGPEADGAPAIRNPLSAEEGFLRTALLPGLVRAVERNWAERERNVRLFEIGTAFRAGPPGERPIERIRVAGVVTGARTPPHWTASGNIPDVDAWDLKGILEEAFQVAGPPGGVIEPDGAGWRVVDASGAARGDAGALEADRPPWAGPLYGFELDVVVVERPPVTFHLLAETPAVERDVALVLPPEVSAAQVETVLRRVAGPLLERLAVFDEYRPTGLPGRSVAWRLVFRDPERTLRDAEIDRIVTRALSALEGELDVRLRQS